MKIVETMGWLAEYYGTARQIGNTHAVVHGIKQGGLSMKSPLMFAGSKEEARQIEKDFRLQRGRVCSIDDILNSVGLSLYSRPVVFDHSALTLIFTEALREIVRLNDEIEKQSNPTSIFHRIKSWLNWEAP